MAHIVPFIDLTDLKRRSNDNEYRAAVAALKQRANTPCGTVAGLCVYPEMLDVLDGCKCRRVTVVNFPDGNDAEPKVVAETMDALAMGADEVDVVWPWRTQLSGGDISACESLICAVRAACDAWTQTERRDVVLKVILETGALSSPEAIRIAAAAAVDCGADFLKTSTGIHTLGASPEAVSILLDVIKAAPRTVGVKVSGGVRTVEQAQMYFNLASAAMGAAWMTPKHFRIGASSLLDDILVDTSGQQYQLDNGEIY
jgi:deoxyribose-phosphate aldolase